MTTHCSLPRRQLRKTVKMAKDLVWEFTAAQAAQKVAGDLLTIAGQFTAAQAAQKVKRADELHVFEFTAAQAAQKQGNSSCVSFMGFTAAQAAQKNARPQRANQNQVHCRAGSSEIFTSKR